MGLVIKKVVDLSSAGEEYEGIQIVFRSIPAKDIVEIEKKQETLDKDDSGNTKTGQLLPFIIELLEKYFYEGYQGEEKLGKEDIQQLDANGIVYCFQILVGQAIDPKDEVPLTNTSTTEPDNQ